MISMTVLGNVGTDPKLASTQGGQETLKFSVASNSGKKDAQETTWVRVTVWGKQATSLQHLIAKGKRVLVVGPAKLREWTGDQGKRTDLELDAREVQIVDYPEQDQREQRSSGPASAPPPSNPGPALPPGVPAGSALHPATGVPSHFCRPGGTAWEPIPAPPPSAPALPPPPAAQPQARAPF